MEKLLEKLTSYSILNNILPGVVTIRILEWIYATELLDHALLENLFIYYFAGMVVNRIGSIIVEPLSRKYKLVTYAPYGEYLLAAKKDEKIEVLLETNNVYRTFFGVSILSALFALHAYVLTDIFNLNNEIGTAIVIVGLIVLFAWSYRKQTKYIFDRVKKVNGGDVNNEHN